jgi:hypothetical protein
MKDVANLPAASLNSFAGSEGVDDEGFPPSAPKPGPPGDLDPLPLRSSSSVPMGLSASTLPGLLSFNPTAKL